MVLLQHFIDPCIDQQQMGPMLLWLPWEQRRGGVWQQSKCAITPSTPLNKRQLWPLTKWKKTGQTEAQKSLMDQCQFSFQREKPFVGDNNTLTWHAPDWQQEINFTYGWDWWAALKPFLLWYNWWGKLVWGFLFIYWDNYNSSLLEGESCIFPRLRPNSINCLWAVVH